MRAAAQTHHGNFAAARHKRGNAANAGAYSSSVSPTVLLVVIKSRFGKTVLNHRRKSQSYDGEGETWTTHIVLDVRITVKAKVFA